MKKMFCFVFLVSLFVSESALSQCRFIYTGGENTVECLNGFVAPTKHVYWGKCLLGDIEVKTFDDLLFLQSQSYVLGDVTVSGIHNLNDTNFEDLDLGILTRVGGTLFIRLNDVLKTLKWSPGLTVFRVVVENNGMLSTDTATFLLKKYAPASAVPNNSISNKRRAALEPHRAAR